MQLIRIIVGGLILIGDAIIVAACIIGGLR